MAKTVSTAKASLTVDLACCYKKYPTTVIINGRKVQIK